MRTPSAMAKGGPRRYATRRVETASNDAVLAQPFFHSRFLRPENSLLQNGATLCSVAEMLNRWNT